MDRRGGRGRRTRLEASRGSVLMMAFWCLMAMSFAVYALHERCMLDYKVLSRLVEREQAYWTAVGGLQKTASYLSSIEPSSLAVKADTCPAWFRGETMLGVKFAICRRAKDAADGDYRVEDEAGRVNLNYCPDKPSDDSPYKETSGALKRLFERVTTRLRFLPDASMLAGAVNDERVAVIEGKGSDKAALKDLNVFRHPFELFAVPGASPQVWRQVYFGEDANESDALDANECDESGYKTYPADDGNQELVRGLRPDLTTYGDGKFNPFTCDAELLDVMVGDFPEAQAKLLEVRQKGETVEPATVAAAAWPGTPTPPESARYQAFCRAFLTRETNVFRVTVQTWQRDGAWRGCLEQVLAQERDPTSKDKYFRPLFRAYR